MLRDHYNHGFGYPDYDKKVDLCLISPPSRASSRTVPISLLFLSAWCNKNGINTRIIDIKKDRLSIIKQGNDEDIIYEIIDKVVSLNPKIIGITAFTTDYFDVITVANRIKNILNPIIVVGGIHAQVAPEDFIFEDSPVNFVAIGEGEETIARLAKFILYGKNELDTIPMLARKIGSDIVINYSSTSNIDYSQMPLLPYWDLDMKYYVKPDKGLIRFLLASGIHIFTALGCPYQCTFCANQNKNIKYRPLDNVIKEIDFCKQTYDIDSFYIQDDTFCIDEKRVEEFLERLNGLPYKLFWGCETRVNLINDSIVRKLRKSGCIQIDFGVESGSQIILNRMKKGITVKQVEDAFRICKQENMRTLANFMFNTPEETEKDVADTFEIARKIKLTIIICGLTVPYMGTHIYKYYVKPKLRIDEYKMYSTRVYQRDDADVFKGRFRLATHNLDLKIIHSKLLNKKMIIRRLFDYTLDIKYWSVLKSSNRKYQYIEEYVKDVVYTIRIVFNRLEARLRGLRELLNKKILIYTR